MRQSLNQKILINNCFSKQSDEADFWAGFIAADGNIALKSNRICIALKEQDIDFIKDFADWCNSKHIISIRPNGKNNIAELKFCSLEMKQDLQKYYNIVPNKSLILKSPNRKSLSFIAGYFMGDGGISIYKNTRSIGFAGTKEMLDWISTYFSDLSETKPYLIKNKTYGISYCGNKLFLNVAKRIFNSSPFYLERKYKLYLDCLKEYHNNDDVYNKSLQLYKNGDKVKNISGILDINYHTLKRWFSEYRKINNDIIVERNKNMKHYRRKLCQL